MGFSLRGDGRSYLRQTDLLREFDLILERQNHTLPPEILTACRAHLDHLPAQRAALPPQVVHPMEVDVPSANRTEPD